MANPQPTDAHLRIAHSIVEQIMVSFFSEQQVRILLFILRLSWECGKHSAYIPRQKDFEIVGVLEGHVKSHLNLLIRDRVIFRDGNYYEFNKDFDQWRMSRARSYSPEKLTELVSINLKTPDRTLQKQEELITGKLTELVSSAPELTESVSSEKGKTYEICKLPEASLASPKTIVVVEEVVEEVVVDNSKDNKATTPSVPSEEKTTNADIVNFYEDNFGRLTPFLAEEIKYFCEQYPLSRVLTALKEACAAQARKPIRYAQQILENPLQRGADATAASLPQQQRKGARGGPWSKNKVPSTEPPDYVLRGLKK